MRILHTSDLHLGRTLYGAKRDEAFEKLLAWLLNEIKDKNVECLLIAGDVFDSATPSHAAQNLYYDFLCAVKFQTNCRHVVVTSGNHDSASFLNAPQKLLSAMGVVVMGAACADPAQEAFLLKDKNGTPEAVVAAVPYLREADIRTSIEHETDEEKDHQVIEGTRSHYEAVVTAADALRKEALVPDIPLIAAGHLFAASCSCGTEERSLYIGSLGQIPAEVFPETIDYLALGHLHRAQCVAGNESRRYAGSPLALDFGESKNKSVVIVDIEKAGQRPHIELLEVPCFDRLEQVCGTADEILARLSELAAENVPMFCEVVHDQGPYAPRLAEDCRDALGSSPVVLVRVMSRAAAQNRISAADKISDVHTITPKAMFSLRLERSAGNLSEEDRSSLIAAHDEVLFEPENEAGTQDAKPASFQSAQAKV